jgi:predicted small lipoprotein YifL
MMRDHTLLLAFCAVFALSACGHKGTLKTPTQVQAQEEKRAKKRAERAAREAKQNTDQNMGDTAPTDEQKDQ